MSRTVIGLFEDLVTAERAERALDEAEIASERITLADRETLSERTPAIKAATGQATLSPRPVRDLVDTLVSHGIRQQKAEHYAETIRGGGAAVIMGNLSEGDAERASRILLSQRPQDPARRLEALHEHGFGGYNPTASPFSNEEITSARNPFADEHHGADVSVVYVM